MSYEIELKAWADDHEAVKTKLSLIAVFEKSFTKEDSYWFPIKPLTQGMLSSGVRVRKESAKDNAGITTSRVFVTYKTKEVRDGIEVNDENEFAVSGLDAEKEDTANNRAIAAFEGLLRRLGLEAGISKKKEGLSFSYNGISAELSLIDGLGYFLEAEIIAETNDGGTVGRARKNLLDLLKKAGISEDKIESRYYTEMLQEKRNLDIGVDNQ